MKRFLSGLLVALFALASVSALACPADKTKTDQQINKPAKPKA